MPRRPLAFTLFPSTTLFRSARSPRRGASGARRTPLESGSAAASSATRSEEHTSELQSPYDLVCRLLLEKKNKNTIDNPPDRRPSQPNEPCLSAHARALHPLA